MKRINVLTFAFVFLIALSLLAFENKTTLLKGTVATTTGEPVTLDLELKPETGPKVKVAVTNGKFEQALTTGMKYTAIFVSKDMLREEQEFKIQDHKDNYNEQSMTFQVKRIVKGMIIKKSNMFESGTANISAQGKKDLDELKKTLNFNRTIEIELQLGAELHKDRLAAIQNYITQMGAYAAKITVKAESVSSLSANECAIAVGKVNAN